MTVFEWCDKHPGEELVFKYLSDNTILVKDADKDFDLESSWMLCIKDILVHNRNVLIFLRSITNLFPGRYEVTITCNSPYARKLFYKRVVSKEEVSLGSSIIRAIFNSADLAFSDMILGRKIK